MLTDRCFALFLVMYTQSLPDEVSLQIFMHLPYQSLLLCSLVSRRWRALACDQTLWKRLCQSKGWYWRQPARNTFETLSRTSEYNDSDDEGMGGSDEEAEEDEVASSLVSEEDDGLEMAKEQLTLMHA
jgi:hypothetical protein